MSRTLPTVGILGGGQLARMLALAAAPLGIRTLAVDGAADACAGQVVRTGGRRLGRRGGHWPEFARQRRRGHLRFRERARGDRRTARRAGRRVSEPARPGRGPGQRSSEKTLFRESGLNTPEFARGGYPRRTWSPRSSRIGLPAILKTRRLGYDGKGQFRLKAPADIDAAWVALGDAASRHGLILEAFVPFERELSVVAVRGRDGAFRTWPLTRNWHVDGVLVAEPGAGAGHLG